ncbi:MAG TPA: prenyltransferase/squalene oxidase repeat-containing protein [Pirellulales bacterium]|jgi:squalene cyclase|nr:prenyltransferase/squalene oxidase repeat-containing protein [Pirellulales bacterium]
MIPSPFSRRRFLAGGASLVAWTATGATARPARAASDEKVKEVVSRGLNWLAAQQSKRGSWAAAESRYPTSMTALSGTALLLEGSTTTQGKYRDNIKNAVDYLIEHSRTNGLIGDPARDDRYTYGHGFSMLFLSQVLGEEEDEDRRANLVRVLTKAVKFSGEAQTDEGGWGYVSAKDGNNFDEGSTTITQVQGLRGCRNAGIPVPKEIIDKAIKYIHKCTLEDGAVQYSSKGGGGRPAISAAAIACLFNAGDYDDKFVPKMMSFAEKNLSNISNQSFGHWHYAHYYFSQVMYREGGQKWESYRDKIYPRIVSEASSGPDGDYWTQGYVGPVYTTATNLTILQLENNTLPIYQR